jgi:hypothetical protein
MAHLSNVATGSNCDFGKCELAVIGRSRKDDFQKRRNANFLLQNVLVSNHGRLRRIK